jgi:hypothetical protein
MNGKCIEPGMLQAFLDGETTAAQSYDISGHMAGCDVCAAALAEAEEASALVFSALDREVNTLVPTQRLWSRINESIEVERLSLPLTTRIVRSFSFLFANPSFAAAAGIVIVAGMIFTVWNRGGGELTDIEQGTVARTETRDIPVMSGGQRPAVREIEPTSPAPAPIGTTHLPPATLQRLVAGGDRPEARPKIEHAVVREAAPAYLPGEESYIRAIADLKQNIEGRKDEVLSPSARVAYERDLAVLNDAIGRMKDVVRRNPNNQAAKQVLYSSYQNKIDLMNSVVEREELLASLK